MTDDETNDASGGRDEDESTGLPITRRSAILSGAWLGGLGLLTGGSRDAAAAGNGGGGSRGVDRSPIQAPLQRKLARADADETFRLQIHTEPDRLDDAVERITDAGGDVRTSYETLIVADVPAGRVAGIANAASVRLAGEYVEPTTHDVTPRLRPEALPDGVEAPALEAAGPIAHENGLPTSEGVERSRADELHEMGITGDGVTIAVLDTGFDVTNERYADQVVATLGADEDDDVFEVAYESPGGHGDGVTDIVAAMAPDADLVLADTFVIEEFGLFEALDTIEADYPAVAATNYSVGHLADFRIDGLDPISLRLADYTEATDSIFVNSAGNSAAVENAWMWVEGVGAVPLPQEYGEAYDSRGPGEFTREGGRELLQFDAHFDEDLPVSTRLPLITFEDVVVDSGPIGWTIVHWDADPEVDDQIYQARLFAGLDAEQPLAVSRTTNPWETIDVLGEYFTDEVGVTLDVEDDAWHVTRVKGDHDVAPTAEANPTLTLPEGQRYRFRNRARREHPLEFRDADGTVLLSQDPAVEGTFEDDDHVAWQATGNRVEFSLTQALADALAHYGSAAADVGGAVETTDTPPIYLEVQRVKATEEHHFDVWASFGGVDIPTPWATDARSVGIPALSQDPDLLSVAAVQAVDLGPGDGETRLAFDRNAGDLKGYSSQGPTQDGRRGIDLAGSSHVSTNARGPIEVAFGMNGTSAAAPHVTGAVGLLSQVADDTAAIREALFATGTGIADPDVGEPGAENTQIGYGYIDVASAYEELELESSETTAALEPPQ